MTIATYAVVNIGCLECREPSEVCGVYISLEDARAAHPDAVGPDPGERDIHGQGQKQILTIPDPRKHADRESL